MTDCVLMRLVVGQAKAAAKPKAMFTAPVSTTSPSTHEQEEDQAGSAGSSPRGARFANPEATDSNGALVPPPPPPTAEEEAEELDDLMAMLCNT